MVVISDCLSADSGEWGEHIGHLNELENLALYPESEKGYIKLLQDAGFSLRTVRDDSSYAQKWYQEIVDRLEKTRPDCFSEQELTDAISGYKAFVKALAVGELRVMLFVALK